MQCWQTRSRHTVQSATLPTTLCRAQHAAQQYMTNSPHHTAISPAPACAPQSTLLTTKLRSHFCMSRAATLHRNILVPEPVQQAVYMYSPSGTPSFFLYSTFSLALRKSACVTRMRRSRSASRPASVHTALMSAPLSSSCVRGTTQRMTSERRCCGIPPGPALAAHQSEHNLSATRHISSLLFPSMPYACPALRLAPAPHLGHDKLLQVHIL